jgi:glycine dehydrogenase
MPIDLSHTDDPFVIRHIGPRPQQAEQMLQSLGADSMDAFIEQVVPAAIRSKQELRLPSPKLEWEVTAELERIASLNQVYRSLIGAGYYDTVTPPVIQRNILENPGWYTQYTPYQAEIAQGRLEALLNFQTMIIDLTALEVANASLLDEATAAAEAMAMIYSIKGHPHGGLFFVSEACHPQVLAVIKTRARPLGITVAVGDHRTVEISEDMFGAILQYPATDGAIHDYRTFIQRAHAIGGLVAIAADLLSLTLLIPPGELGADVAVGSTQRFGVPLGFGGPHAAYLATHDTHRRFIPGRIIGVSIDSQGNHALRMALQTREQHIRREKATSNICTAQVLLAVIAGMYGVYHGPDGLKRIAERIHTLTRILAGGLEELGHTIVHKEYFDTLRTRPAEGTRNPILAAAQEKKYNFREYGDGTLGISLDELSTAAEVEGLLSIFARTKQPAPSITELARNEKHGYHQILARTSAYMQHPVFNIYHSETEMLRYIRTLESKDLSLTTSMIPLGSCTMKLNATAEMIPISWPAFAKLHPFAPPEQAEGYHLLFGQLEDWLKEITGLAGVSMQPNSGAQGEFTGLMVIRSYHEDRGESHRNVCLIPSSAHGTNPASAVMAGMEVVVVRCDEQGNIDLGDVEAKAEQHRERLGALMVTYPSTHGVFEEGIKRICAVIHQHGGQVYMDGANMNAQVGLCRPGELGADVVHLNLHKTFCIPHGGGGPGMGPIAVARHLSPFLPGHPLVRTGGSKGIGSVSAAPWGSPSILPISWVYIALMGGDGLTLATKYAILNANYMAKRLENAYPILYQGSRGRVAHEFILDFRDFKGSSGIEAEDIAKRLMDYGFHAPTVSFPVAGTMMIEPTESESKEELDRFCDALLSIRKEIREIEEGKADRQNNLLKNAPHTSAMVTSDAWSAPYSRERAAFPTPWTRERKFWPSVGRVNNAYGDRHLVCSCPPIDAYEEAPSRPQEA